MFQCLPGLYSALFDKVQEKAKCHPLTRFALMALARKKPTENLPNCPKQSKSKDSFGGTRTAIFSKVTRRTVAFKHYYIS